ncbi:hypothetical protein [Paenibacillus harenae]|nr:hypothetical protein [Paenibacillus harenae]
MQEKQDIQEMPQTDIPEIEQSDLTEFEQSTSHPDDDDIRVCD